MDVVAAHPGDLPRLLELLESASLPAAGAEAHLGEFLVARDATGGLVGCIGVEVYGDVGLLRSLVVSEGARRSGLGRRLVEALLDRSRERSLRALYLLTTTAEDYFPRFGFAALSRDEADERLRASEEFRGACPDTAVLMRLEL